jgi:hypothetical protein
MKFRSRRCSSSRHAVAVQGGLPASGSYVTVLQAFHLFTRHHAVSTCCAGDVIGGDIILKKVFQILLLVFSPGVRHAFALYYIYLYLLIDNMSLMSSAPVCSAFVGDVFGDIHFSGIFCHSSSRFPYSLFSPINLLPSP